MQSYKQKNEALSFDFSPLIPDSGCVRGFISNVSTYRNRPIEVLESQNIKGTLTGLWVPKNGVDYILYAPRLSSYRRDTVVCHELAHMLLGHSPRTVEEIHNNNLGYPCRWSFSGAIQRFNKRNRRYIVSNCYESEIERNAEMLGSFIFLALKEQRTINDKNKALVRAQFE